MPLKGVGRMAGPSRLSIRLGPTGVPVRLSQRSGTTPGSSGLRLPLEPVHRVGRYP